VITALIMGVKRAQIGVLTLDASVQEIHTASATVTKHPVAVGSGTLVDISDHVKVEPIQLSIEGVISNHPLIPGGALAAGLLGQKVFKAQDAWEELLGQVLTGASGTIVTSLRQYDNMVLENVTVTRDKDRGADLFFRAQAIQVSVVELREAALLRPVAFSTTKKGGTAVKTPKAPAATESRSIINKLGSIL
jgi:hypothetical protein